VWCLLEEPLARVAAETGDHVYIFPGHLCCQSAAQPSQKEAPPLGMDKAQKLPIVRSKQTDFDCSFTA